MRSSETTTGDTHTTLPDDELAVLVDGGDTRALNALCRRHYRTVFQFAYRLTQNVSDAEDCTQEAFMRFVRSWSRWQERSRGAGPWLATIARNVVVDRWQREFRLSQTGDLLVTVPLEEGAHTEAPDEAAVLRESIAAVQCALNAIDPECRELIDLLFRDRLTHKEAADKLGASHEAIKKRYQRCLRRLQAHLRARGWL